MHVIIWRFECAGHGKAFVQMNIDLCTDAKYCISIFVAARYPVCIPVCARNMPDPTPDTGLHAGHRHCWTCYAGEGNKRVTPFLFTGALAAQVEIA